MLNFVHGPRAFFGLPGMALNPTPTSVPNAQPPTHEKHHRKNPPRVKGAPQHKQANPRKTTRQNQSPPPQGTSNQATTLKAGQRLKGPTPKEAHAEHGTTRRDQRREMATSQPPPPTTPSRLATARRGSSTSQDLRPAFGRPAGRRYSCKRAGLGIIGQICPVCFQCIHWNRERRKKERKTLFKINNHNLI